MLLYGGGKAGDPCLGVRNLHRDVIKGMIPQPHHDAVSRITTTQPEGSDPIFSPEPPVRAGGDDPRKPGSGESNSLGTGRCVVDIPRYGDDKLVRHGDAVPHRPDPVKALHDDCE